MTKHGEPFLIVVDSRNSALALVATQRGKILASQICYASDFKNPNSLFDFLLASDKTKILFAWRGALREALESTNCARQYIRLLEAKTIHILIPDLLGTSPEFLTSEARLVNVTHGYWVTSNELHRIYTTLFPLRLPSGVLHDIPDISLILKIRKMKLKKSGIIWVGNSQWGSNYGYVDHKGYAEVVQPLLKRRLPLDPFRIKDSFICRTPNDQVLREIAESEILIQASAHEGTGLPLLEALGVGTIPITSDVGIAREVLAGYLEHLIVERNVNSFEDKIREIGSQSVELSNLCISAFDSFIEKIGAETIEWERRQINLSALGGNFSFGWRMRLTWLYRFYRSRRNR